MLRHCRTRSNCRSLAPKGCWTPRLVSEPFLQAVQVGRQWPKGFVRIVGSIPALPKTDERGGFYMLLVPHISLGGRSGRLPILTQACPGGRQTIACLSWVARAPGQIATQKTSPDGFRVGLRDSLQALPGLGHVSLH